jgi:hypothetical protein
MIIDKLNNLIASTLDDIQLVGFVDGDETPCTFYAQLRLLYLEVGGDIWELRCVEDTGTMRMRQASNVSGDPDQDGDLRPATMSVRELILDDPDGSNRIEAVRLWNPTFGVVSADCWAAQFDLENGQVLFIDPSYHFGIRLGRSEQRDRWLRDWPGADTSIEWKASPGG